MQNKSKPEHLLMELLAAVSSVKIGDTPIEQLNYRLGLAVQNAETYLRDQGLHLLP